MYLQTAETDEGQDQHSWEKNEDYLVTESRKVRPNIEIMKRTLTSNVQYRAQKKMMESTTRESVDTYPYLLIPDLVRIKGYVSVCSFACNEVHNITCKTII